MSARSGTIRFAMMVVGLLFAGAFLVTCLAAQFAGQRARAPNALKRERVQATEARARMGQGKVSCGAAYVACTSRTGIRYNRIELCFRSGKSIIDDASLKHLEGLTSIVGLDLSGTAITDAGLASLQGLMDLEYLQLANTTVTDRGLEYLKSLPNLQALDLADTKVSQEGAKLLERLPRLKSVYAKGTSLKEVRNVRIDTKEPSLAWMTKGTDPLKSVIDMRKEQ